MGSYNFLCIFIYKIVRESQKLVSIGISVIYNILSSWLVGWVSSGKQRGISMWMLYRDKEHSPSKYAWFYSNDTHIFHIWHIVLFRVNLNRHAKTWVANGSLVTTTITCLKFWSPMDLWYRWQKFRCTFQFNSKALSSAF